MFGTCLGCRVKALGLWLHGLGSLPIGSKVVPFRGLYLESYKVIPKKELLWSLWVASDSVQGLEVAYAGNGRILHCVNL